MTDPIPVADGQIGWLDEARAARDEGVATAIANPTTPPWTVVARDAITYLASTGRSFTAEDVRRIAGEPPTTAVIGAVLLHAAREGLIRQIAYTRSPRKASHAGIRTVWKGNE